MSTQMHKNKHTQTRAHNQCVYRQTHTPSALMKINMARGRFSPAPTERDTHIYLCCIWGFTVCVCEEGREGRGGAYWGYSGRVCAPHCLFNVWKCMCIFKVGGLNLFLFPLAPFAPSSLHTSFPKLIDLWMHDRWRERQRWRGSLHGCVHACMDVYTPLSPCALNTCYKVTNPHMHIKTHL